MKNKSPKFSLILCTIGRKDFVINFLSKISQQKNKSFEIILVDQNNDNSLQAVTDDFPNLNIKYLKSKKGLSVGRNVALKYANGDIISFPDDDCEYPSDILDKVEIIFDENDYSLISMKSIWKDKKESNGNFDSLSGEINKFNVLKRVISYTIFVKKDSINNLTFDEKLGVGAKSIFQCAEEVDFVLQVLSKNIKSYYFSNLFIYHPHVTNNHDDLLLRLKKYEPGKCYFLIKNKYPNFYIIMFIFYPFLRSILSIFVFDRKGIILFFTKFKYRFFGYIDAKKFLNESR